MRVLLLLSPDGPRARARVFSMVARGLTARGHDAQVATANATLELRKQMQGVDVCFVHTENELLMAASAAKLAAGHGAAVIRRVPPFCVASAGTRARLVSRFAPTGLLFTTVDDREAAAAADASAHRLAAGVAPVGVDLAEADAAQPATRAALGVPAGGRLIACVHDGVAHHHVLALLRSIALLAPRHPELHVAVIGATRTEDMRMHGASLGVNGLVSYLGASDDDLSVIRAADFGWIAAADDAAALAALDFMACRIPVLADRTALTQHYVADGLTGVLLPPADATTTAASLSAFLARGESHKAMGNAGRARVQREFSFDTMIRGFEEAIASATGGTGGRTARSVA